MCFACHGHRSERLLFLGLDSNSLQVKIFSYRVIKSLQPVLVIGLCKAFSRFYLSGHAKPPAANPKQPKQPKRQKRDRYWSKRQVGKRKKQLVHILRGGRVKWSCDGSILCRFSTKLASAGWEHPAGEKVWNWVAEAQMTVAASGDGFCLKRAKSKFPPRFRPISP